MNSLTPALFVGHGSPMNALEDNADSRTWRALEVLFRGLSQPPRAILAISAHWLTRGVAVTAMAAPETIHDFSGFPRELGELAYPAAGDPVLAARVASLLAPEPVLLDREWGLDHGVWSVLVHLFPAADIPVVQLSLDAGRDAAAHYQLAMRLRPLRDEGVLIMASGNVVHNLQRMDWQHPDRAFDWALRFSQRVRRQLEAGEHAGLCDLSDADAQLAVPTPEHFLPLLYLAAVREAGEPIHCFNDHIEYGSIGMLSCRVGGPAPKDLD